MIKAQLAAREMGATLGSPDQIQIAPEDALLRYLCLFRRWLIASQDYVRNNDPEGIMLSVWIAHVLHNVPTMLWQYNLHKSPDRPERIARWVQVFPQIVRDYGASDAIASRCEWIFSSEGAKSELRLEEDLRDLDFAPDEKMAAYLDLVYHACLAVRSRPGSKTPWADRKTLLEATAPHRVRLLTSLAELLGDVPLALVHWKQFDEVAFAEQVKTLWSGWPLDFGLSGMRRHLSVQRLSSLFKQSLPEMASVPEVNSVLRWLVSQYTEPERVYHNLEHVERMFALWDEMRSAVTVAEPQALSLAIWFHDAIYDPTRRDNEESSADEAVARLRPLTVAEATLARIHDLILATASHHAEEADADKALLLDVDLAILGAEAREYDRYARAIREEYKHVLDADYRPGRAAVLRKFLDRPRIYLTRPMYERYEAQARINLAREISALMTVHDEET